MGAMKAIAILVEEMRADIPELSTVPDKLAIEIASWVFLDGPGRRETHAAELHTVRQELARTRTRVAVSEAVCVRLTAYRKKLDMHIVDDSFKPVLAAHDTYAIVAAGE